ncbi:MAG: ABC-2 family transporter protein [Elusimicrobiota bacterium]
MFLSRAVDSSRYYLSVWYYYAKLAVQRQMEYPVFLVSWFVFNFLQWFGWYYFLKVLSFRFNGIAGWAFPELLFLFSLSLMSHGLVVIFFVQTWMIGRFIVRGQFDQILMRPMDAFYLFMVGTVNFIGIADLLPGIVVFIYACSLMHFHFTAISILKIIVVVLGATLIRTSLFLITNSSQFWWTGRFGLSMLTMQTIEYGSMYPLNMYPYLFQVVLTYALPIGFISFYPSLELMGKGHPFFSYVLLTLFIGMFLFLLGYGIFNMGMKRYESVGN